MARKTFRQYAAELSPTVLQGEIGQRFIAGTLGLFFDLLSERVVQGVRARLLNYRDQPLDAVAYLADERMSPRYAVDTDATHLARVRNAWARWAQAGREAGMLDELAAFGLLDAEIILDSDWDWDGAEYWSRFWVVVHAPHPWTYPPDLADPGLVLDGTWTLGSSATPEEVDTARRIVRRWKPAHMICSHIIVVFDADEWTGGQPDGTWDWPTNRNEGACFWDG
jgi:hypothetical protein